MKKDNTAYYIIGAIAAYYAYQWWKKNKQSISLPVVDQSGTVTTVTPTIMTASTTTKPIDVIQSLQSLTETPASVVIEQAPTYQTFYGQIQGVENKKVPYHC